MVRHCLAEIIKACLEKDILYLATCCSYTCLYCSASMVPSQMCRLPMHKQPFNIGFQPCSLHTEISPNYLLFLYPITLLTLRTYLRYLPVHLISCENFSFSISQLFLFLPLSQLFEGVAGINLKIGISFSKTIYNSHLKHLICCFCAIFKVKYCVAMFFSNHYINFLFTFYTVSLLFWEQVCRIE